jgi:RND family efflux transporter MFP subunit
MNPMQTVLNSQSISALPAPPRPGHRFGSGWIIPAFAFLALLFALVSVIKLHKTQIAAPPPTSPPASAFANSVAAVGLVEANTENIALSVPVPGWVTEVYAHAGDHIQAGQPLFSLDHRDLDAELAMRQAQLAQAVAHVPSTAADAADADLLQRDALRLDQARVISKEDAERKRIALDGARARLAEARAQVTLAEAQVRQTQVAIERLTISSPITGVVLQSDVRPGQYASSGPLAKALMMLGNIEPLHIRVDIDEQDASRVRAGQPAFGSTRGAATQRLPLTFVRFEPYVVPKVALTGDSTERTDTRVLQAIYRIDPSPEESGGASPRVFVGQQMDVYIGEGGAGKELLAR